MRIDWVETGARRAGWELAAGPGFTPRDVPEIASGYWWDAANTTGFGTTGFRVLDGNGHSSFDLIQATLINQPTVLTEAGGTQFRFNKFSVQTQFIATSGNVVAGWTGATYVGGWFRLPDGFTGSTNFWRHPGVARLSLGTNTASGQMQLVTNVDGATTRTTKFPLPSPITSYHWIEGVFDPLLVLGGSVDTDRAKVFYDFVASTAAVTASIGASLNDASGVISVVSSAGGLDRLDWSSTYYANGIPSLANRKRLANFRNPSGVLL